MMRDFYTTYRGRRATTEEFAAIVSEHCGRDMGWFFDQWIRGKGYPRLKAGFRRCSRGIARRRFLRLSGARSTRMSSIACCN